MYKSLNLVKLLSLGLVLLVLITGCYLKSSSTISKRLPELNHTDSFIIYAVEDSVKYSDKEVVGDIKVYDTGLSLFCEYEQAVEVAEKRGRKMGANAMKIYQHIRPNIWSNCHKIRAKALYFDDIWRFEKEITWYPKRRLKIRDFKADTTLKPYDAATASGIGYKYEGTGFRKGFVEIRTIFFCHDSYFKIKEDSIYILAHEQLHFDISELYARKFAQIIKSSKLKCLLLIYFFKSTTVFTKN
jgi:hypothetical protein